MNKSEYGLVEILENAFALIYSKLFIKNSRLVRLPISIRGKKHIEFGNNLTTGKRCIIGAYGEKSNILSFGDNVNIGNDVRIIAINEIHIGNNVLMGSKVLITDNSHGDYSGQNQDPPNTPPNGRMLHTAPVIIEDNVWIGEGVVIQKGVTIGSGTIIGANSVVTKSIPSEVIAAGIPTRVLKRYNAGTGKWERVES